MKQFIFISDNEHFRVIHLKHFINFTKRFEISNTMNDVYQLNIRI